MCVCIMRYHNEYAYPENFMRFSLAAVAHFYLWNSTVDIVHFFQNTIHGTKDKFFIYLSLYHLEWFQHA